MMRLYIQREILSKCWLQSLGLTAGLRAGAPAGGGHDIAFGRGDAVVGNRVQLTRDGGRVTSYEYDAANRLTRVDGVAYTWDANGNLLSDGVRSYSYDHANRLVRVVSGTLTTEFAYNGVGDRVAKTVNGVTTDYVLDPAAGLTQVLVESTGGQTIGYLYGADLLAQYDSGRWAYHVDDGLGSVRQLAGPAGEVTLGRGYTPFGVPLWSAGRATSGYGFTGERWDGEVALLYLRARYYEPGVGRFLTEDIVPGYSWMPRSLHLYVYAWNNPVRLVDPSGRQQPPGDCLPGGICFTGTMGPYNPSVPPVMPPVAPACAGATQEPATYLRAYSPPVPNPRATLKDLPPCGGNACQSEELWVLLTYRRPGAIYGRATIADEWDSGEIVPGTPRANVSYSLQRGCARVFAFDQNLLTDSQYYRCDPTTQTVPKGHIGLSDWLIDLEIGRAGAGGLYYKANVGMFGAVEWGPGNIADRYIEAQAKLPSLLGLELSAGVGVEYRRKDVRAVIVKWSDVCAESGPEKYGWKKIRVQLLSSTSTNVLVFCRT